ncbi:hypothetical protein L3X38_032544 [Prunus dulcis]|uniref:Uncharacterized protein n=1 Tax=Prunus dulcis TaxID=3755 RepID=A0AAD4VFY6_PRUDU|nr:hypothetical protein L3X38_032544 [Prunus dulcis]
MGLMMEEVRLWLCDDEDGCATMMMEVRRQRDFCYVRMGLIEAMEVVVVQIYGGFSRSVVYYLLDFFCAYGLPITLETSTIHVRMVDFLVDLQRSTSLVALPVRQIGGLGL